MADTTPKELNAEEQAAMDAAKRDLEASKARIGQTPEMYDPLWLLTKAGQEVLKAGLGRDPVTREPYPVTTEKATVIIPRPIKLMLTHHHVFDLQPGVREIPACLLALATLRNNGVKKYEGSPSPVAPQPILLGTGLLRDPVKIGDHEFPLGSWVIAAYQASGMSPEKWNALRDDERAARIQAEIDKGDAAANAEKAEHVKVETDRAAAQANPQVPTPGLIAPVTPPSTTSRTVPLGMPGKEAQPNTGPMNSPPKK
jgi:hypothetical protein